MNIFIQKFITQFKQLYSTPTNAYTLINLFSFIYISILLKLYNKKFDHKLSPKFKILNILLESQRVISILVVIIRIKDQHLKYFYVPNIKIICIVGMIYFNVVSNICVYEIAKLARLQSINPNQEIATEQYVNEVTKKCQENRFLFIIYLLVVILLGYYYYCDPIDLYGCQMVKTVGFTIGILYFIIITFLNLIQLIRTFDYNYSFFPLVHIIIRIMEIYFGFSSSWVQIFALESLGYGTLYTFVMLISMIKKKQMNNNTNIEFIQNVSTQL